jgi:hypothetical protein
MANPTRKLASWFQAYAKYTEGTEAPAEFHMWTAVSTIAGALNRKCWIDMGSFSIYPSMYIIFVAPPGVATKSTTAGIGTSMLDETESIQMASSSGTWQAMLDELQEAERVVTLTPGKPQVTISPLHVFASELGTFLNMSDNGQIDMLVDLWDGKQKFKRRTRGSGVQEIIRPYVNLLGCTTPSWLSNNAEDYFIGGGFFSRTIFVYADTKQRLIPYPTDTFNHSIHADLQEDLKQISKLAGEFTLDEEAKAWGTQWYIDTYENTPEHLKGEKFQGYIARRQNHLHKVAMVVSAGTRCDMVITQEHMEIANGMLFMAESNLKTIYDSIVTNDKIGAFKLVKQVIKTLGKSSKPALFNEVSHKISYDDFENACKALLFSGEVKSSQKSGQLWLVWNG